MSEQVEREAPRAPPIPMLPRPVGGVASRLYAMEVGRRNRRFDRGVGVTQLDRPVIGVGNLSMGGTGKTPMVHRVVRTLQAAGRTPCIAMRGYRAKPGEIGDEEGEHRRSVPGVPVVAQPDRLAGLRALFASGAGAAVDCVVLDDGFQHRRIARDLDIVLIDATRSVFTDRCFPAGWLREPVESLARADVVVLTHAERATMDDVAKQLDLARSAAPEAIVAVSEHGWAGLTVVDGDQQTNQQTVEPIAWLRGKRVAVSCGIGHPEAFLAQLAEAIGGEPVATLVLPDHGAYTKPRLARLRAMADEADVLVTTAKDWSKLGPTAALTGYQVAIPRLEITLRSGEAAFDAAVVQTVERAVDRQGTA